jgi:hypothetical protein
MAHELIAAYDMLPKMRVIVCATFSVTSPLNHSPTWNVETTAMQPRADDRIPYRRIRSLSEPRHARDCSRFKLRWHTLYVPELIWVTVQCSQPVVLVGDDNPAFEGVFEFCSISAGGSLGTYFNVFLQSN